MGYNEKINGDYEHYDFINKFAIKKESFRSHVENRKEIRDLLINDFIKESPGTGAGGLSTKFIYSVEKTSFNEIVYIQRPAHLNKGMDFMVYTTPTKFPSPTPKRPNTQTDRPSHKSIYFLLEQLKQKNHQMFTVLMECIELIYQCEELPVLLKNKYSKLNNKKFTCDFNRVELNISFEIILYVVKWLFIEQDITYWNYSGRNMLYSGIKSI